MERHLGTVGEPYEAYIDGNRVIVRGPGIEWNHSIQTWRRAPEHGTELARQVMNLINIEFGPDL